MSMFSKWSTLVTVPAMIMVLLVAPVQSAAAANCNSGGTTFPSSNVSGFGGGTGVNGDPWLICSRAQLEGISTNATTLDGHYLLSSNLDLGGQATPWTPIGNSFTGVFDGQGFAISNIYRSSSDGNAVFGLFNLVTGAGTIVKNLSVSGELVSTFPAGDNFSSAQRAGIIAASVENSATIDNVNVSGAKFSGLFYYSGGAVGYTYSGVNLRYVTVENLDMTFPYRTSRGSHGGITGYSSSTNIHRVKASGTFKQSISTDKYNDFSAGGLVGALVSSSTLRQGLSNVNWTNTGSQPAEVFGNINIGAMVGTVDTSTVQDCAAIASATSIRYYSGLFGKFDRATITAQRLLSVVTTSSLPNAAPVVRTNSNSISASNSFFDRNTWGDALIQDNSAFFGVTAKSSSALKLKATYEGASWSIGVTGSAEVTTSWSLSDANDKIWRITEGEYPQLVWLDFSPAVVTFKGNYVGAAADVTQTIDAENGSTLGANSFVRSGHVFDGWNTEPDGSGLEYFDEQGNISSPLTLYAQWRATDESSFYRDWQSSISTTQTSPVVGDTVWASAYERTLTRDLFKANIAADNNYGTPEEYVYRITKEENVASSSVDSQPQAGYTPLSVSAQNDWYENDLGFDPLINPYEFSWSAFLCMNLNDSTLSLPQSLAFNYASREDIVVAGGGVDSVGNSLFRSVMDNLYSNSSPSTRTVVGSTSSTIFHGAPQNKDAVLGFTDVTGACAAGSELRAFRLVDQSSTAGNPSYISSKSIQVTNQFLVWNYALGPQGEAVALSSLGVTIGVTGRAANFNAALWGLTTIGRPITSTPAAPSVPYLGPLNVKVQTQAICSGSDVVLTGQRMDTIAGVELGSKSVTYQLLTNGNLRYSLKDVLAGRYQVKLWVPVNSLYLTSEIVVGRCDGLATAGRVNVGSFNGKLVVYASGLEGKRISWKVGGRWGRAVASSDAARFDRPTPRRGVDVVVEIYVGGKLELTKTVRTR